jgi:hypothetical protein
MFELHFRPFRTFPPGIFCLFIRIYFSKYIKKKTITATKVGINVCWRFINLTFMFILLSLTIVHQLIIFGAMNIMTFLGLSVFPPP